MESLCQLLPPDLCMEIAAISPPASIPDTGRCSLKRCGGFRALHGLAPSSPPRVCPTIVCRSGNTISRIRRGVNDQHCKWASGFLQSHSCEPVRFHVSGAILISLRTFISIYAGTAPQCGKRMIAILVHYFLGKYLISCLAHDKIIL